MRRQATLTVAEGKRLIARAVVHLPEVRRQLQDGAVLLLGGTTVSAIAEELGFGPLWISGRIDPRGCRTAAAQPTGPHNLLVTGGTAAAAGRLEELAASLDRGSIVVTGANALDSSGQAGLAFAAEDGGERGRALRTAMGRGLPIIIACGLEKLVPGSVAAAARRASRLDTGAMGAAIDLYPLAGRVVTEREALVILYGVEAAVIAGGGIQGAEGSKTFLLEGPPEGVKAAYEGIERLKGASHSGVDGSMEPCFPGCSHCRRHSGCIYCKPGT